MNLKARLNKLESDAPLPYCPGCGWAVPRGTPNAVAPNTPGTVRGFAVALVERGEIPPNPPPKCEVCDREIPLTDENNENCYS